MNKTMVVSCAKSAFHGTMFRSIVVKGLVTKFLKHLNRQKPRKSVNENKY